MKQTLPFIAALMIASGMYAQKNETRSLSPYTQVRVANNVVITLAPGAAPEINLSVKNTMNEKVKTEVSSGEFKITTEGVLSEAEVSGTLYYTTPPAKLIPTYGGMIRSDIPVTTDKLEIEAKLDGYTRLTVEVKDLVISAGQGSDIYISGKAENVTVNALSGAKVHLENLECTSADVTAGLGSKVWLTAIKHYRAKATMGSKIYYSKEPAFSFEKDYKSGGEILMQ